jgi:alanyl-tRNA synthetase
VSEGGIASGVRRIEAVAGAAAVDYLQSVDGVVRALAGSLKARPEEIAGRVAALQEELKAAAKQLAELQGQLAVAKSQVGGRGVGLGAGRLEQAGGVHATCISPCLPCPPQHTRTNSAHRPRHPVSPPTQFLASQAVATPSGAQLLVATLDGVDAKAMQEAATTLLAALGDPAAVLLATSSADGKANFVCALSPAAVKGGLQAGKVVGQVAKVCGGGGGGKPALAQAGGKDASKLEEALEVARTVLAEGLK